MGISEAYGRAIGTNFGFPSIAQSPPPEPELPLPQRRSGALAQEGGKKAKLAKPTLRTSGSSMLIANQHKDPSRPPRDVQASCKRPPGKLHDSQIDFRAPPKSTRTKHPNGRPQDPKVGTRLRERIKFLKSAHTSIRCILVLSVH